MSTRSTFFVSENTRLPEQYPSSAFDGTAEALSTSSQVSLNQPNKWWVNDAQKTHTAGDSTQFSIDLPAHDGTHTLESTRSMPATEWVCSMTVVGDSYMELMNNKAELERLFNPSRRMICVSEKVSQTLTLFADGYCTEFTVDRHWYSESHVLDATIKVRIPSGSWFSAYASASVTSTGTTTYPALSGGSAPQYAFELRFTPSAAGGQFAIQPGGDYIDATMAFWADSTVLGGTEIVVNSLDLTAKQGSKDVSKFLELGGVPMHVPPSGAIYCSTLTNIPSLSIKSFKAWY